MATEINKSIIKAFDLLDLICSSPDGLSLREAAATTKQSIAATHRIFRTLKSAGAVHVSSDGTYAIGRRLLAMHEQTAQARRAVQEAVDDHLKGLLTGPNMCSRMSVLDLHEVYIFAGADTCADPNLHCSVGARYEAYCTAPGKVLLASLTPRKLDEYVFNAGFVALTERTIVVPSRLAEEIKRVQLAGYAVDDGEFFEGVRAASVPVRIENGPVIAALSLAGMAMSLDNIASLVSRLTAHAADLADRISRIPGGLRVIKCHDAPADLP